MCLAVPMKLNALNDDGSGVVDIEGTATPVNLSIIESPEIGDYLIVHAGFAIEKLDEAEADARLELFNSMTAEDYSS